MQQIALDAMGGDLGTVELVAGAVEAVRQYEVRMVLCGDENRIHAALQQLGVQESDALQIIHAPQVISMDETPFDAVRKKKDSSIVRAFHLLKEEKVDAVVSAGNSGATMAAAVRYLGRLPTVSRPGIAGIYPTLKDPLVMMDVGANVDCRPQHLLQFGAMAAAFSEVVMLKERPRVGLLSIGEEGGKGNTLVKKTHDLFRQSSLNYVGNVEGRDIFKGDVDVIVCDGFVGNVCLKVSEGLAEAILHMLRDEISQSLKAKIGYALAEGAFKNFKKRVDYAEYGGAPLLGLNGTGIICHGRSNAKAIRNAVRVAKELVANKVNDRIETLLSAVAPVWQRYRKHHRPGDDIETMSGCIVIGTGCAYPERAMFNRELEEIVDTSDEWIVSRTGIKSRYIATKGEETSQLAADASRKALVFAGVKAEEIDLIVLATISSEIAMPSCACLVQKEIGAVNAFAFDINAACCGFAYGLDLADKYIRANPEMKILVIGAETLSSRTNWQDRNTCVLFGDGAGACVVTGGPEGRGLLGSRLFSDGRLWNLLYMEGPPSMNPDLESCREKRSLYPDGRTGCVQARSAGHGRCRLSGAGRSGAQRRGSQIHYSSSGEYQDNSEPSDRLGVPAEKVYVNIDKYGNTSAASVPIAIDEINRAGRLQAGDLVLLCTFGAGLTWGASVLRW